MKRDSDRRSPEEESKPRKVQKTEEANLFNDKKNGHSYHEKS